MGWKKNISITLLFLVVLGLLWRIATIVKLPWWLWGAGIILSLLLFVRYTTVEEGTSRIIKRFGGVIKVFIQWAGYKQDQEGDVVPTNEKTPKRPWYGGLRVWVGLPFDKVYKYNLRWHSVEEVQGERAPVFHEKKDIDHVELRPHRYYRKSIRVETADGQFPNVGWLVGMRSINPEKTTFKSPHNWVENALTELEPLLRQFCHTEPQDDLIGLTRKQIWTAIGNDNVIKVVLREEWGIQIDEEEIAIFDIDLEPESQKALASQKQKGMESAGRAEEILGTVISAVVRASGKPEEQVQKEFDSNPESFYAKHKPLIDNTMTKLAMEKGSGYLRIETPGADGIEGAFLRFIGAWQGLSQGKTKEAGTGKKGSSARTTEELEESVKKFRK